MDKLKSKLATSESEVEELQRKVKQLERQNDVLEGWIAYS